ncbi:hypothetical protein Ddc_09602 [Ditylenchus destructor]|nr:hypothetical protein Ddc_09602 [Ditylenchus destructor]
MILPITNKPIVGLVVVTVLLGRVAEAIRCYCTDDNCVPFGVCEASTCLVGLVKANNQLIRTCGNEPLGCRKDSGKWTDLCVCEHSFCNTFSYLRENTHRERARSGRDGEDLVFQRVDSPLGDFSDFDPRHDDDSAPSQSTLLTLLLVIVPLSVGGATVLVVAFNYYCHLC